VLAIFRGRGIAGDTTGNSPGTKWTAFNAIAEHLDYARRYTARTNQVQRSFEDMALKQPGWTSSSPPDPKRAIQRGTGWVLHRIRLFASSSRSTSRCYGTVTGSGVKLVILSRHRRGGRQTPSGGASRRELTPPPEDPWIAAAVPEHCRNSDARLRAYFRAI
jgi:hypothetical protein